MNIHEYQGKDILRKFGVAVPNGIVAYSPEEAKQAAEQLFAQQFPVELNFYLFHPMSPLW